MRRFVLSTFALVALGAGPMLAAQGGASAMLGSLQRGQWSIVTRDGGPSRSVCLGDGSALVQLRHGGSQCSRFVVEDTATRMTVQYTCKRSGYGITSIRKETSALVQIETRGVERGRPFQFTAEARRTGTCR